MEKHKDAQNLMQVLRSELERACVHGNIMTHDIQNMNMD